MHALLALMRERGVEAVAVEVSAQALSRRRVDGIVFDVAGFTNLTHDHLDDYADMREYFEAKLPLFRPDRARRAVVCLDSAPGAEVVARSEVPTVTVGTPAIAADPDAAAAADWVVEILDERQAGTEFRLASRDGRSLTTVVPVIGRHMAANAGLAIVMILEGGYAWERLVAALDGGRIDAYLPGRTELVSGERGPAVYVDFGHSPDAFEKTLAAVRRVTPGKVVMLFGADGDRDATKRHDMGRAGVEGSDILVITDHHPRFEDPDSIRATLIEGARRARPDADIHEFSPAGAGDRRGRRARRRRRRDPLGRPRPPGLPRHPRGAHAVLGARTRPARAQGRGLARERAALAGALPARGLTRPTAEGAPRSRPRLGDLRPISGRGDQRPDAAIARSAASRAHRSASASVSRVSAAGASWASTTRSTVSTMPGNDSRPSWNASTACSLAALNTAG